MAHNRASKSLSLSVILSILELTVWLGLAWAKSSLSGEAFGFVQAVSYIAGHIGEIIIGIATTFYVVFTYHMMDSSDMQQRRASEPLLTSNWTLSKETAPHHFTEIDARNMERLRSVIGDVDLRTISPTDIQRVSFVISNARDVPIDWVKVSITAQYSFEGMSASQEKLHLQSLNLTKGQQLAITVLDLSLIPSKCKTSLRIDTLLYGPAETGIVLDQFAGNQSYEVSGAFALRIKEGEVEIPSQNT